MLRRILLAGVAVVGLGVFVSKAEAHPWGYYGGPVYGPVVYHSPVIYGGPAFYGGPAYYGGFRPGFNVNYSHWDGGWGRRGWGGPGWGGPGWGGPRSGFSISIGRGGWGW